MTGLFIIAHAPLASALREAALHTFPEAALDVAVFDVPATASAESALADAAARLAALGTPETLILTRPAGQAAAFAAALERPRTPRTTSAPNTSARVTEIATNMSVSSPR